MNYKLQNEVKKSQNEIQKIENLIFASEYSQVNTLSETNLLYCHKLFSKTLLSKANMGNTERKR